MIGIDYYIFIALLFGVAGIYVWQRGFTSRQNISFGLICIGISMWLGGLFYLQHAADFYWADKLTLLGGLLSIAGFYMFSVVFPAQRGNISFSIKSEFKNNFYARLLPLAFWLAVMPFNLIIKGAASGPHGPVPVNGPLFPAFGATEIIYMAAAVRNFYLQFKNSIGYGRQRIVYVLAGMSVFLISVIIFDISLPSIGITALNFIGPLSSLVFLGMSATAIISFNLFDVRLVLKNVLVYAFSAAVTIASLLVIHDTSEGRHIFSSRAFILAFLGAIVMFAVIRSAFNFIFQKYFLRGYYRSKQAFALLDNELIQPLDAGKIIKAANHYLRAGLRLKWVYFFDMKAKRATGEPEDAMSGSRVRGNLPVNSRELHDFAAALRTPRFFYGLELPDWTVISDSPTAILPIWDSAEFCGYFVLGPQMSLNGMSSEQMYKTHAAWAHLETALARAALRSSLEEQVKAQVQDIMYKNRKLKEAAMIQLDYAQMVSHQLRTPVTVLQGALELVLNPGIKTNEQNEILRMARQSSLTLSSIIEDVLSLARIRKASGREKMTAVDLPAVISKIMAVAKPMAKTKNIDLRLDIPEKYSVTGNSSYLEQALFNIIENALQNTPDGGMVSVSVAVDSGGA
ncbi:hypothetical protein KGQ24_03780, partial [Patescibacteria group bacterium]|nr:hypothetical protein [Patescibacteria group bacterium]